MVVGGKVMDVPLLRMFAVSACLQQGLRYLVQVLQRVAREFI